MSESLPPACAYCQELLFSGPDALAQVDVRNHLSGCVTCRDLCAQYREIDRLLLHIPDLKPLPDLALRFQQLSQAQHISELQEDLVFLGGMVEEKSSTSFARPWSSEPIASPFFQGKKTMQKLPITSTTKPANDFNNEHFQLPVHPTRHSRRPFWSVLATSVAVLLALLTIFAWILLPRLNQSSVVTSHGRVTSTTAPITITPTPGLTQQYTFTVQDSGRTVTFGPTERFSLGLDQRQYPQENLQLSCDPLGALGSITNVPYAAPPLYAVEYQANEAGTCVLNDGSFTLTVIIGGGVQTPTPVPSPTQQPATSTPGLTQQYAFTVQDNGRTVTYGITTRFSLSLNQQQYPQENLQLSCNPQGALGSITGTPYAAPPLYAVEYQANEAGTCVLKDGNFTLTVVVTQ